MTEIPAQLGYTRAVLEAGYGLLFRVVRISVSKLKEEQEKDNENSCAVGESSSGLLHTCYNDRIVL
jgi:hypothetical protein